MTKIPIDREVLEQVLKALQISCLRTVSEAETCQVVGAIKNLRDLLDAPSEPKNKPNCKECAKWVQEQADNKEWIDGVAEGRRIVEKLAAKEKPE